MTVLITLTTIIASSLFLTNLLKKKAEVNAPKQKVYFDMDGNCDDMVAFLILLSLKNIDIVGVSIVPADCEVKPAKEFVTKILTKKGIDAPVLESNVTPVNDFPREWKSLTLKTTYLPTLLNIEYDQKNELDIDAAEHMYETAKELHEKNETLTILITGPPSTLTKALKSHPDMKNYIKEVYWMGGAIDVEGNVYGAPHSEYNAYWNPTDTKEFIESGLKIKILSLDSTNSVPVNKEMLSKISKLAPKYDGVNLVNELFAIAFWTGENGEEQYYAWDCVAAMALGFDGLIKFEDAEVEVITEKSESDNQEGRIQKKAGTNNWVKYGQKLDEKSLEKFYELFIDSLKYNL